MRGRVSGVRVREKTGFREPDPQGGSYDRPDERQWAVAGVMFHERVQWNLCLGQSPGSLAQQRKARG